MHEKIPDVYEEYDMSCPLRCVSSSASPPLEETQKLVQVEKACSQHPKNTLRKTGGPWEVALPQRPLLTGVS